MIFKLRKEDLDLFQNEMHYLIEQADSNFSSMTTKLQFL